MKSKLDILVGMVMTTAFKMHDYVQLLFEQDISLTIYNNLKLFGSDDMSSLNGATFLQAHEKQNELILHFSDGKRLDIDMCDEAYNGPEALELHVPGRPIVVWN